MKNSLVITPRMTLGLAWEYQFEQDLLALDYDYKLKNKYALDLRWDAYDWLKIASEARRETDITAAAPGADDERTLTDTLRAGFDITAIDWLRVAGKAEFKSEGKIAADTGGSVDKVEEEKYELDRQEPHRRILGFDLERHHVDQAHRRLAHEPRDQDQGRPEAQVSAA